MDPTAIVKKAPKWAWYTAAGVGIGGFALKFYRNRTTSTADETATNPDATVTGTPTYGQGGSPAGVIVPPVIVSGGSTDQSGTGLGALQELYLGGVQGVVDAALNMFGTVQQQNLGITETVTGALVQQQDHLLQLANAGSAPQPVLSNPTPVYTPVEAPAPAPVYTPAPQPAPAPAPAFRVTYENRTRDNGKTGSARRVWCNRVTIHRYTDGRPPVVVSEDKIRDGAC